MELPRPLRVLGPLHARGRRAAPAAAARRRPHGALRLAAGRRGHHGRVRLEEDGPDSTIVSVSQTHFDLQEAIDRRPTSAACCRPTGASCWPTWPSTWRAAPLTPEARLHLRRAAGGGADRRVAGEGVRLADRLGDGQPLVRLPDRDRAVRRRPLRHGRARRRGPSRRRSSSWSRAARLSVDWGDNGVGTWELAGVRRQDPADLRAERLRPPAVRGLDRQHVRALAELRRFHEMADWSPIWLS